MLFLAPSGLADISRPKHWLEMTTNAKMHNTFTVISIFVGALEICPKNLQVEYWQ